jgi:hypothetical protein
MAVIVETARVSAKEAVASGRGGSSSASRRQDTKLRIAVKNTIPTHPSPKGFPVPP